MGDSPGQIMTRVLLARSSPDMQSVLGKQFLNNRTRNRRENSKWAMFVLDKSIYKAEQATIALVDDEQTKDCSPFGSSVCYCSRGFITANLFGRIYH